MNRLMTALGIAAMAAAVVVGYHLLHEPTGKLPHKVFDDMEFASDFDKVVGDKDGTVCHQIILRHGEPQRDERVTSHQLFGRDFRKLTGDEKREAIRADTRKDMEESGLACIGPDGQPFLSQAFAGPPKCEDCSGGDGCHGYSCAATIHQDAYCTFGGVDCVITVICCGHCQNPCP